jgi:hypothetical protein
MVPPGPSLLAREAGLRGLWHTPSGGNARLSPPLAGPEQFRNAFDREGEAKEKIVWSDLRRSYGSTGVA